MLHYVDETNLQVVRHALGENGWHLFTVRDGNRDKRSEATVPGAGAAPQVGDGFDLRVRSQGGRVTAYEGEAKAIDHVLPPEAASVGRVGLFVRGENRAAFDSFSVRPDAA